MCKIVRCGTTGADGGGSWRRTRCRGDDGVVTATPQSDRSTTARSSPTAPGSPAAQTSPTAQGSPAAQTSPTVAPGAREEVVDICRDLIRIPSVNRGDGSGPGERAAAEHVAGLLSEVGLDPELFESAPGRASVVCRVPGADPDREPLLVHGHLDVVPADAADWKVDPFSGEIVDGCVWGRGAVDMKDMDAMTLAVVRERVRTGRLPARPLVLAFFADEEAGSRFGAQWAVEHRRELFDGVRESISEVGGYSVTVADDLRVYLVQAAERGIAWLRLRATGTAGHGAMINPDNAVATLARAVTGLADHPWPMVLTPTVRTLLTDLSDALDVPVDLSDEESVQALVARLGPAARVVGATLRNTLNPTQLEAGYKVNVVPGQATAGMDGRFLPGQRDEFFATVDALLPPGVTREVVHADDALEEEFAGALVEAMRSCLVEADPAARVVPYTMFGGTDGKPLARIGIATYGFTPLQLPPGLDFTSLFHGVDERVPVDALRFGVGVLDAFLDRA